MPKPPSRSKYTLELHEQIVSNIRKGYPKTTTFRLVGLSPDTGWAWLRQGRDDPDNYPHYVKLAEDIAHAIAEVQAERVDQVLAAARDPKHWTAAAWYLERTDPETWGRKDRVEVNAGESGAPLFQLNQLIVSDPEALAASRTLLHRLFDGNARVPQDLQELPRPRPLLEPESD